MPILTDADDRLRTWVRSVVGDVPVLAGPPGEQTDERSITAFLVAVEPTTKVGGDRHRPAPVVLNLRYLLCADAPEPRAALQLLDTVVEAALDAQGLEVDLVPLPFEAWLALGVKPRPVLSVCLSVRHVRTPALAPIVREPLRITSSSLRSLSGRLLGPDDVAMSGSQVTLAATGVTSRTSQSGAFTFSSVPAGPGPIRLDVRAKGQRFTVDIDPIDGDPVVVHCDLLEG